MSEIREGRAFDAYAPVYDVQERGNAIKQHLRRRSLESIREAFPRPCRLLDIGAGTGTEALALARDGYRVVAVDPSPAMLARLRQKAAQHDLDVPAHVLRARDVDRLGSAVFDGAYASFGGLNLEPDLGAVARAVGHVVRRGGTFVSSTMTRYALLQAAGGLLVLRPRQALRRLGGTASFRASPGGPAAPVHYPSLRMLRSAFAPHFTMRSVRALNLCLPGPAAWRYVRRAPWVVPPLAGLDAVLGRVPGLRAFGDHVSVVLVRREV